MVAVFFDLLGYLILLRLAIKIIGLLLIIVRTLYTVAAHLTAVFFETGSMTTPTKSPNLTKCGSGGSFQSYLTHS